MRPGNFWISFQEFKEYNPDHAIVDTGFALVDMAVYLWDKVIEGKS